MAAGLTAIMHGLECIPRKGSVFHHSTSIIIISGITHTVKYHEVRGWCEAIGIQFWYYPLPAAAAAIVQEVWTVFLEQPTQTTLATRPLT